jgi:adenosine deaminase
MKATDGTSASTADAAAAAAADDDMNDFIINAPKVELHAHLNGCIRESTLFELAQERSVTLSDHHFAAPSTTASSPLSDHSHSIMYNVRPRSLQDCFDMFAEIPKCVNDLKSLRRITLEALADFASHHVVYLELRSTPKQLLRKTGGESELADKRTYCMVVLEAMKDFEQKEQERFARETAAAAAAQPNNQPRLPMISRLLVAIDRSQSVEDADEHVELAKSLRHDYGDRVAGVDLGGNPTKVCVYA